MAEGCEIASAIARVAGLVAAIGTAVGGLCTFGMTVAAVATATAAVAEIVNNKKKYCEKKIEGD